MSEITIHNFIDIKDYFKALVDLTSKIKMFKFGGFNRIIEALKSEMEYPCLFLELPEKGLDGGLTGSGLTKDYKIAFNLIASVEKDDYQKQDDLVFVEFEHYIEQIIRKVAIDFNMEEDAKAFKIDPIFGFSHDNAFGWRVAFELEEDSAICRDATFWDLE